MFIVGIDIWDTEAMVAALQHDTRFTNQCQFPPRSFPLSGSKIPYTIVCIEFIHHYNKQRIIGRSNRFSVALKSHFDFCTVRTTNF